MKDPKLTDKLFSVSFKKLKDKTVEKKIKGNRTENNNLVNRIYYM